MAEFEEIVHSGGKFEFLRDENGSMSFRFTQSNPWALALFQICVSLQGELIDVVEIGGIGQRIIRPQPSILVYIVSDRQGFFGRICPSCKSYFRTTFCGRQIICPYCGLRSHNLAYTTPNQLEFLTAFFNAYVEASEGSSDITIDLDSLSGSLTNNSTAWIYSEEKQQNLYRCDKCHVGYDILGEYAGCPSCGRRNYMHVFGSKIGSLEKRFQEVDEKVSDRHEREVEWERLIRCVSEFEAMANDLRNQLLLIPAAPRRKSDLQSLSFQNIKKANDCIGRWFGFEILEGLSVPDRDFLNIMFNRRHVFTHNAGRVDQEYIDNTGDTKLRLNQLIRLRSQEVKRLLPLIRGVAEKLVLGFESIR